jgi:hypothetical protein
MKNKMMILLLLLSMNLVQAQSVLESSSGITLSPFATATRLMESATVTTLGALNVTFSSIQSRGVAGKEQLKDELVDLNDDMISGASSHIEGNHGTFFPEGWMWTHAIAPNNTASFSCIAGKFVIGMLSPLSIVFYLRRNNGEIIVFRTTDLDQHRYCIDGKHRNVSLECSSFLKGNQIKLTITARQPTASFHTVYVPTVHGFSNQPGCQECYTAIAKVILTTRKHELEEYEFPLTALEFGGSFLNAIFATK